MKYSIALRTRSRPGGSCVSPVAAPRAEIIEQILVKVNGEIFTKTDLETAAGAGAAPDAASRSIQERSERRAAAQGARRGDAAAAGRARSTRCCSSSAARSSATRWATSSSRASSTTSRRTTRSRRDEQFQAALKQENMTLADLRRNLERQMIVAARAAERGARQDRRHRRRGAPYYDAHLHGVHHAADVTLREILVAVPTDAQGVERRADEDARGQGGRDPQRACRGGESFEKLAAELSDAPSKANAGLIGPLSLDDLSPDLRKLIESMKVGDISRGAAHAARLPDSEARVDDRRRDAAVRPGARADQRTACSPTSARRSSTSIWQKLRAQAIIEWKNDEVKKAYEEGAEAAGRRRRAPALTR